MTGTVSQVPPKAGDDLVTSINAQLQQDTENALAGAVQRTAGRRQPGATSAARPW